MSTQKHSAKRLLHYTGYFTDKIQLFQQGTLLGTGKPIFSYSNFLNAYTFRPGKNRQRENSFYDPCFNGSICTHFIGNRELLTIKCFLLSYTASKPTFVFLQLRREGNSSYNKNHPSQHFG